MTGRTYSRIIAQAIDEFLANDDWRYSFDEQKGVFKFSLSIKGKIKNICYLVVVKDNAYIVYAIAPIGADEDDKKTMSEMAEFVCRANYGIKNGNFELDMDDGELRFKCYVDCDGIVPTTEIVKSSIYCPATMFDHYGDGIVDIIFGGITGKEAVERCEKSVEEELRSILSQLARGEGDGELCSIIDKLAERQDVSNDSEKETVASSEKSVHIKTDLFSTEGENV